MLQKEVQDKIHIHEDIVQNELAMMEAYHAHYMDLCATMKKDKEEIEKNPHNRKLWSKK